jgi:hypothetical protein
VTRADAEEAPVRRLVQHVVDQGTCSRIRVYQTGPTAFVLELASGDVLVTKAIEASRSVTTIRAGADELVLSLDPSGVIVSTGGQTARLTRDTPQDAELVRNLVRGSSAVHRAAAIVRAIDLPVRSPLNALFYMTRATLLSAVDDRAALAKVTHTVSTALREARAVRVVDEGPGECWNEYAKEAIAAFMEFEDCVRNASLIQRLMGMCEILYTMRASGAFAWWLKCVGLSNVAE